MNYEVILSEEKPQLIAATRAKATGPTIGARLTGGLSVVWEFIRSKQIAHKGINVVIYNNYEGVASGDEFDLICGVLVEGDFQGSDDVFASTTAGRAAATTHVGPYSKLDEAHKAVLVWCKANGHSLAGTKWEVYGHWTPNEAELTTEVFYLLK